MSIKSNKKVQVSLVAGAVAAALGISIAQAAQSEQDATLEEVIVTGTRRVGIAAVDSPAPVQVLSEEAIKESGAPDLVNEIATLVPSYNANQNGGDMANNTLTASLRALSANHALVLVNGKRRHITSNTGASSGNAAADLSFIPDNAVKRIEVLTDGAAALYGSDAIAGVINIILKDDYRGGNISASYGGYTDGGGGNPQFSANAGFGNERGFFNVTAEYANLATVDRVLPYGPALCVANPTACLAWVNTGTGNGYTNLPVSARNSGAINGNGATTGYLNTPDVNMLLNPEFPSFQHIADPPQTTRRDAFFNAGYKLSDTVELYSFGNYGKKTAWSYENYRRPSQDGGVDLNGDGDLGDVVDGVREAWVNKYPYGFNPKEAESEVDWSLAAGIKGETAGWNWDFSSVYGRNDMDVYTNDSMNFTLWNQTGVSQEDFYDGTYYATQWVTSLDVSHDFDVGLASPLTFAAGVEYRHDEYGIQPGEPASYYGVGASSFPGYNPAFNTGDYDRDNYAAFANFIFNPVTAWVVDLAGRYEHYSDFGSKTVGKLTTRYDFNSAFAVRATASTGFRAPTLGEEYYSAINVSPTGANPQLQANSPGAAVLGFGDGLQPETSVNLSLGFVLTPVRGWTTTVDAYRITIKDRIGRGSLAYSTGQSANTATGRAGLPTNSTLPDPADTNGDGTPDDAYNVALGQALVNLGYIGAIDPSAPGGQLDPTARANLQVSIFNNALKTRTSGVDLVSGYRVGLFDAGSVDLSVAANYNKTDVLSAKPAPAVLGGAVLYSALTLRNQEVNSPRWRLNLGATFNLGQFSLALKEAFYGPQYSLTALTGVAAVDSQLDQVEFNGRNYYKSGFGTYALTNFELAWKPNQQFRLSFGADNLFNKYPGNIPQPIYDYYVASYSTSTARQVLTGSPIGYFGRRLFGKVSYNF